ncbi:battenin isoform X2 [Panulirus ornatus]|uniref:battenin isoform X2 n=1 Tax=Panulirus ornatus TaxID=150431 RepID=UPI003A84556F
MNIFVYVYVEPSLHCEDIYATTYWKEKIEMVSTFVYYILRQSGGDSGIMVLKSTEVAERRGIMIPWSAAGLPRNATHHILICKIGCTRLLSLRVVVVVALCSCSFLLVGKATSISMAVIGVIFASASAGLGEVTFISYSAHFHRDMISTWSSGTGGAGVFGALTYAGLTSAGLNPHTAVLLMLIVPIIMSLSFWVILDHPYHMKCNKFCNNYSHLGEEDRMLQDDHQTSLNLAQKLQAIPRMFKYMIPLGMVYVAEYVINQGLLELIYFPQNKVWMNHHDQYRWYQVTYQIGVLISRSSVNLIHVHHIWMTSVLQWINLVIFLTCAIFWWIGSIWMVLLLIFWEGLLGGAAYVNTFYRISQEVDSYYKEFAMGITTVSDSLGVAMAGIIAIPLHNVICNLPLSSSGT